MPRQIFNETARDRISRVVTLVERDPAELTTLLESLFQSFVVEGVTAATLPAGGSALVDVYVGDTAGSNWAAHPDADQVTARYPSGRGVEIPNNKWIVLLFVNGEWRPIAAEC